MVTYLLVKFIQCLLFKGQHFCVYRMQLPISVED